MTKQRQIHSYLARRDPRLKVVLNKTGIPRMPPRRPVFDFLLDCIISQQLSVKAAETIHGRFIGLFPGKRPKPALLARMSVTRLRTAGVSRQKAGYLKEVARFTLRNDLGFRRLSRMTDAEVLDFITQIKGVGRWTGEIMLMFDLGRPDVFPVDDLGIRNTMIRLYRLRSEGNILEGHLRRIAESWHPYRTYACMALWRWKDSR